LPAFLRRCTRLPRYSAPGQGFNSNLTSWQHRVDFSDPSVNVGAMAKPTIRGPEFQRVVLSYIALILVLFALYPISQIITNCAAVER
jgi:hypothetical protein